jgi:hypothetical protein
LQEVEKEVAADEDQPTSKSKASGGGSKKKKVRGAPGLAPQPYLGWA